MIQKLLRLIASRVYIYAWCWWKGFSPDFYLTQNPDVRAAGVNPRQHFFLYGRAEGRLGNAPRMVVSRSLESLRRDRETVLVVSHEGSRTGAPILSYNLTERLVEKYNVVALFLGPGPLLQACHAVGAAVIGPVPRGSTTLGEWVVKYITDRVTLKFALVNSIESRSVLPALAKRHVPAISLIHEFAAYTRPLGAFRDAMLWSGQTVFSSRLTRDDVLTACPDLGVREHPVIPQGRCTLPSETRRSEEEIRTEASRIRKVMRPEGFSPDGLVVVGAGFIHFRKGVDLFVECAARVAARAPDLPCRFVWVGKGYEPDRDLGYSVYLADQIRRAGLEDRVHFSEEVVDLEAAYALADVLLLSSRLDPLPNVVIDALALGLPVVCFDKTTGMAELLRDHGLGDECVAGYLDAEDMASKVVALARSKELRARVKERGVRMAATTFDMAGYVASLEQLAAGEVERARQERRDVETIAGSAIPRLDFLRAPHLDQQSREEAIRAYVRSWSSGVQRRKPFPGFHPGIYLEQHGTVQAGADPFADYVRAGRPPGPWDFELVTPEDKPAPIPPGLRVGLHIHAYYTDVLPDVLERLARNRARPDLLISVDSEAARGAVDAHLRAYRGGAVDVRIVPNRGRDIGPFLTEFGATLRDRYDVIGHLHTKKTVDVKDAEMGRSWYQFLLENLLGGQAPMADVILGRMAHDANIGMVFPDDPYVVGWDKNLDFVKRFLPALGIESIPGELAFPVGTMFWARPGAIERLFALGLKWTDYPNEPLPYDGSMLHGLERLLGLVVTSGPFAVRLTNVPGRSR